MDQLSKGTPGIEANRRPWPRRKILRIALGFWRAASMIGRLSEVIGWLAG